MSFLIGEDQRTGAAFEMVAMVDVVFILLAFFVLSSQFRRAERDFAMGYGESSPPGEAADARDLPSHIPVRLSRSASGVAIRIGQARLADNDFDAIRAKLAQINIPAIGVQILAEADLTVDQVARALDAVLASPMKNVSISGLQGASGPRSVQDGITRERNGSSQGPPTAVGGSL